MGYVCTTHAQRFEKRITIFDGIGWMMGEGVRGDRLEARLLFFFFFFDR